MKCWDDRTNVGYVNHEEVHGQCSRCGEWMDEAARAAAIDDENDARTLQGLLPLLPAQVARRLPCVEPL